MVENGKNMHLQNNGIEKFYFGASVKKIQNSSIYNIEYRKNDSK